MCEKLVPERFFLCAPYFERVLHGKIGGRFRCEHCSFQVWVQWSAPYEIFSFGIWKQDFMSVFAVPSTLHADLNSL